MICIKWLITKYVKINFELISDNVYIATYSWNLNYCTHIENEVFVQYIPIFYVGR